MAFDAQQFLNTVIAEPTSTEYIPVPLSDEGYPSICTKVDVRTITSGPASQNPGQVFHSLATTWEIDDQAVRDAMGQDHPTIRYDFILEIDDSTGLLAKGEGVNVRMGKLREATGLNSDKSFNPMKFKGAAARVVPKHRLGDGGEIFSEVKAVFPLNKVA